MSRSQGGSGDGAGAPPPRALPVHRFQNLAYCGESGLSKRTLGGRGRLLCGASENSRKDS